MRQRYCFSLFVLLTSIWLSALLPTPAAAEYLVINNYQVDITVQPDAVLDVEETITVEFSIPRHGIVRKLPVQFEMGDFSLNQDRNHQLTAGRFSYVVLDARAEDVELSTSKAGDYLNLRMGSPDQLVQGEQKYKFHYRLFGAVNFFSDHAELYWNAIGHEWETVIKAGSIAVHLPRPLTVTADDFFVFTGHVGTKGQDAFSEFKDQTLSARLTASLGPAQGLTFGIKLPKDYLSNGTLALQARLLWLNSWFLLLPILALLIGLFAWFKWGREPDTTIVPLYKPPQGMTPTEAAFVSRKFLKNQDLTCLLYYWGAGGFLKMTEVAAPRGVDLRLEKVKDLPENATSFEYLLFSDLFQASTNVTSHQLKDKFYAAIERSKYAFNDAYKYLVLRQDAVSAQKALWILAALSPTVAFSASEISVAIVASTAVAIVIFVIAALALPARSQIGREKLAAVLGFKEFVDRVEIPRLEAILKEEPNYFDQTLAFAIALGIGSAWAKKFESLNVAPPTWYVTNQGGAFNTHQFFNTAKSNTQTVTENWTSRLTTATSGQSGFSGSSPSGGSSGGGGGGGGGSSW